MKKILFTALMGLSMSAAMAMSDLAQNIEIKNPFSRVTSPTVMMGGAFMTIANKGTVDDVLVSVKTPVSPVVELHKTVIDEDGVMRMRAVEGGIKVPAGQNVELKPGGLHIMLMDLKQPLKLNDEFPMTLTFAKQGEVTIKVIVDNGKSAGYDGQMMDGHEHHDHEHHDHEH